MTKFDFKKELKQFYSPSGKQFSIVTVPSANFLQVDGFGDPNKSKDFAESVEALYAVSYTLKFYCKKTLEKDYSVMPMEGLWWADDMDDYLAQNKNKWKWTIMIWQPEFITKEIYSTCLELVKGKGKNLPALPSLRLSKYEEGLSAQILYQGSYANETNTIKELHKFIEEQGFKKTGYHHEIYLNDSRRVAPEKLKTIIRQPMKK